MFDGVRRCIELPTKKLDTIILELKLVFRQQSIPYKRFEKAVDRLRHAVIGLLAGRGLCDPFNKVIFIHPKRVWLGKNSILRSACGD